MAKLTARQRDILLKNKARNFACPERAPGSGSYPISDRSRTASAKAYYQRAYTAKCAGGKRRICAAAKRFGMMGLGD